LDEVVYFAEVPEMATIKENRRLIIVAPCKHELRCLEVCGTLPKLTFAVKKPKASEVVEIPLGKIVDDFKVIEVPRRNI
jgi:hypothetical protein